MHSHRFPTQNNSAVRGSSERPRGAKPPTILLVEDEDFVREATVEILESCGYRVLPARSSAEAVELFCKHRQEIQLLLTDVVLPGQNGPRLASYLQTLGPGFKTLLMSGYPVQSVPGALRQNLSNDYVPKPFSFDLLLRKIRQMLPLEETGA